MKDLTQFCMTKHEAEIKALCDTPLGAQRFQLFIRRWEINNEPIPTESKPDKFDHRGWPIQARTLEAEEEDYFNADDDEDDYIPPISHSWNRGNNTSTTTNEHAETKEENGNTWIAKRVLLHHSTLPYNILLYLTPLPCERS